MTRLLSLSAVILFGISMFACKPSTTSYDLKSSEWRLDTMATIDVYEHYAVNNPKPTIQFSDSAGFSGFSGCNLFFGNYLTKDGMISFDLISGTMAICPDSITESAFYNTLARAKLYEIENDSIMKLMDKSNFVIASLKRIK